MRWSYCNRVKTWLSARVSPKVSEEDEQEKEETILLSIIVGFTSVNNLMVTYYLR